MILQARIGVISIARTEGRASCNHVLPEAKLCRCFPELVKFVLIVSFDELVVDYK